MPYSEQDCILKELSPPFLIKCSATQTSPVVFCSPHSGRVYPSSFISVSRLSPQQLRKSEDCYVDELFEIVPSFGAPLIMARFPRAFTDVNREPYELDPALFSEPIPKFANTWSSRVIGGLGTIARIVAPSEEIYAERLPLQIGLERIKFLYEPFHIALNELIEKTRRKFGFAILIDCHSMPSTSIINPRTSRPDFVVGDRFGTSCDRSLTQIVRRSLAQIGRRVQVNQPYAGGYITEHYGRPNRNVHAIQVEVNRKLYLDEATLQRSYEFNCFKSSISEFCRIIITQAHNLLDIRDITKTI
ncbi:MAG: hypothetical protein TECD_00357 [Hyphomicrobiaceae bacterium hypho_1]